MSASTAFSKISNAYMFPVRMFGYCGVYSCYLVFEAGLSTASTFSAKQHGDSRRELKLQKTFTAVRGYLSGKGLVLAPGVGPAGLKRYGSGRCIAALRYRNPPRIGLLQSVRETTFRRQGGTRTARQGIQSPTKYISHTREEGCPIVIRTLAGLEGRLL